MRSHRTRDRLSRRRFATRTAAALLAAGVPSLAAAAPGTDPKKVTATVSADNEKTRIGEGIRVELTVRVEGSSEAVRPNLPLTLEGNFEIARTSSSRNFSRSFGMGRSAGFTEHTTALILIPVKAGEFDLQFEVEVDGVKRESNSLVVEVLESDTPLPGDPVAGSEPTEAAGDIFLWATTDKTTAYIGEQVTYMLDVYERRQFLGVHLRKPPSFSEFFSEELPLGEATVKEVAGVPYRVEPGLRRALFAQRVGTAEIGSAEISVSVRKRLKSPPLQVEVLPLPPEGRPAEFSPNNVGKYAISAEVDRTEVDAGEPFTLTVKINGDGNISVIDPGRWEEVPGVRRYAPKSSTRMRSGRVVGGERVYEFLMIPERGGTLTIPEHVFHYFDPDAEKYEKARAAAIEVTVLGDAVPVDADEVAEAPAEDEARIADVVDGERLPRPTPRTVWLTTKRWVYGMVAVPAIAGAWLGGSAAWRRFGPDDRARTRARERMRQQLRIKAAHEALQTGEGFHATVSNLLHELAARRAGPDGVGLPRTELLRLIGERGATSDDITALRELLDRCDAARFAAQVGSAEDRQVVLDDALLLVKNSSLSKEGK